MTLRAKIDLASGNFNMRDPVIYRIRYINHHRQGTKWCIYPMYDFAHPIQDALEGITHSLCSLEFEDHRPLYDWVVEQCLRPLSQAPADRVCPPEHRPHRHVQAEAAPAGGGALWSPAGTIPGCPPCAACAAGATPPAAIRNFCERIGVGKTPSTVEYGTAGALPPGGSQRHRPARHGGAASGEADDHQLSRGQERGLLRGE